MCSVCNVKCVMCSVLYVVSGRLITIGCRVSADEMISNDCLCPAQTPGPGVNTGSVCLITYTGYPHSSPLCPPDWTISISSGPPFTVCVPVTSLAHNRYFTSRPFIRIKINPGGWAGLQHSVCQLINWSPVSGCSKHQIKPWHF